MNFFEELAERGIINTHNIDGNPRLAVTNEEEIKKLLNEKSITIYVGFDPTAPSLHVGHLLPILTLAHFQRAGHKPIALIGGATGQIGDPSGKSSERQLLTPEIIKENIKSIKIQLEKFLSFEGENAAIIVNNLDWTQEISYIDFLRKVGKFFTVNYMMAKESVRSRLEDRDQGISYTEFSYMLLQAYDFLYLHDNYNCLIQGGGSDQWGNITAGCDLVRKTREKEVYGITYPLVTTASGQKFGKSEGNAVWLSEELSSPYQFYQFWFNTDDRDVEKYLKLFTFLSINEISEIIKEHNITPEKRIAQKRLASEITKLVHGEDSLNKAVKASSVLFGGEITGLTDKDLSSIFKDVPSAEISKDLLNQGISIVDLLVSTKIIPSKGEARRLIDGGGLYLNNENINSPNMTISYKNLASETKMIIRKGKKNYYLVKFV